ncbi:MAG: cell division protein FtsZ [Erysipelotrichales bacterium]|nr:cell division protein FtsZ [Erysipelotrichales bacterium]MBQ2309169.1 cell division protein FtsZ [Erysipelotrichales bacterium]MBQ2479158.1 cell division protein FtsZ [Erysipelotrichales bacterium]MBQ4375705.1 cell division protein FtsZ [Erysipelotrichales bacterium]MBQ5541852.1 cell division protein FtsZ [Erysipelotrichales bacterium]
MSEHEAFKTRIKVFGVGGAGCNAVTRMVNEGVQNVDFYLVNLDQAVLDASPVENKISLGKLGAGGNPEVGRKAAEEHEEELKEAVKGADMVFVTAGLGGGTGTGATPLIAKLAKEQGALTVGVVTKPFLFEGKKRMMQALNGLDDLKPHVDSLIIISNQKLLSVIGNIPITESFKEADNVLRQAVQTITDLVAVPILVNVDFNDVRSVMKGQGNALIGIGMAEGEDKAKKAAVKAIQSPLLEAQISGAKNAIVNVTGGPNVTLLDAQEVTDIITQAAGTDLDIIWGVAINEKLGDAIIVTVIATGFESPSDRSVRHDEILVENKEVNVTKEPEKVDDFAKTFRFRD